MANVDLFRVDTAPDGIENLSEALQLVATNPEHIRTVCVIWQPPMSGTNGYTHSAQYTIISEQQGRCQRRSYRTAPAARCGSRHYFSRSDELPGMRSDDCQDLNPTPAGIH
jgi:hypothetical protein